MMKNKNDNMIMNQFVLNFPKMETEKETRQLMYSQSVRLATPASVVMGTLGISPFMVQSQLQIYMSSTDLHNIKKT